MAEERIVAALSGRLEFEELRKYFDEKREDDVQALARKTFANPSGHDQLEWERLRAFYRGVDAVFEVPTRLAQRKEWH